MNKLERAIKRYILLPLPDTTCPPVKNPYSDSIARTDINFASHRIGRCRHNVHGEILRTEFDSREYEAFGTIFSGDPNYDELKISASLSGSGIFGINVSCFNIEGKTTDFFRPRISDLWPLPAVKAMKVQLEERTGVKAWALRDYWQVLYRPAGEAEEGEEEVYESSAPYNSFIRELSKLCDKATLTDNYAQIAAQNSRYHRVAEYLGFPNLARMRVRQFDLDQKELTPEAWKIYDKFRISRVDLEYVSE